MKLQEMLTKKIEAVMEEIEYQIYTTIKYDYKDEIKDFLTSVANSNEWTPEEIENWLEDMKYRIYQLDKFDYNNDTKKIIIEIDNEMLLEEFGWIWDEQLEKIKAEVEA